MATKRPWSRAKIFQSFDALPGLRELLHEKEIDILITLGDGAASATAWGCDLTYDYVKINGDYRT